MHCWFFQGIVAESIESFSLNVLKNSRTFLGLNAVKLNQCEWMSFISNRTKKKKEKRKIGHFSHVADGAYRSKCQLNAGQ